MMRARAGILAVLAVIVLLSALGVVYTKHESRKLFVELQQLQATRDELQIEWGQLQLEQSTWSAHGRIEQIAERQLHMVEPQYRSVVVVKP